MNIAAKYGKSYFMPPEVTYDWVKKDSIEKPPIWCSVDLRDGNQALIEPMGLMRSKDPNTQVGACIVSQDNKILSMGYNGLPRGCSDDEFPWNRDGEDNKYFYTTHSELNAILNYRGGSLDNAKLYVTLFPCNECAKAIIQAGIKTVVYDCDKYADTASVIASKRMLNAAGVRYYKYERTGRTITIDM